jgi:hypothetical protein
MATRFAAGRLFCLLGLFALWSSFITVAVAADSGTTITADGTHLSIVAHGDDSKLNMVMKTGYQEDPFVPSDPPAKVTTAPMDTPPVVPPPPGKAATAATTAPDKSITVRTAPAPIVSAPMPVTAPSQLPTVVEGGSPDPWGAAEGCPAEGCEPCQQEPACCNTCCGNTERFWVRTEYLLWWTRGAHLPPLVTTSPAGTPANNPETGEPYAGALGQDSTQVLFGDSRTGGSPQSGLNLSAGMWLNCCHTLALEGNWFYLGRQTTSYSSGMSNGYPILARPFYSAVDPVTGLPADTPVPDREIVAIPIQEDGSGGVAGSVDASFSTSFGGGGLGLRQTLCCSQQCCCSPCEENCCDPCCVPKSYRIDLLYGYRYYSLNDDLGIHESLVTYNAPAPGTTFDIHDRFRTENLFNGVELGVETRRTCGRWSFMAHAKAAFGDSHTTVRIDGSTVITGPTGASATLPGGLLALPSTNMGTYHEDEFVVIPELGGEIGYQITSHLRAYVGYDFLYWTHVARAGDQIDLVVDPRNLPDPNLPPAGGPHPQFNFQNSDFWAQGLRFGGELTF